MKTIDIGKQTNYSKNANEDDCEPPSQTETRYVKGPTLHVTQTESTSTTHDLQLKTLKSRVSELESLQHTLEKECKQLRNDKLLLVDHVSEIQRKLESKDQEVLLLRTHVQTMEAKIRDAERMNMMESSIQSQKWEEFEKLAESMRSLSHTMSHI